MIRLKELSTRAPEGIDKTTAKERLLELNEQIADKIGILHAQKKT